MTKINYKSDFDFILTLRDAQGNDIGFPKFNWEARFWTFSPMCAMTASCHDGECVNCFNDNGKIHIVFNAPTLGCGQLRVELVTHRENDIYPDGERTLYTPDVLDIELVSGKGDAEDVNADIVFPATGRRKSCQGLKSVCAEIKTLTAKTQQIMVVPTCACLTHNRIWMQDTNLFCYVNACASSSTAKKEEMITDGTCTQKAGIYAEVRKLCA